MKKAFTLAEVLITLAIIGTVAAISIPSVISSTQQSEYKTGLKKAVTVLNSAITMNMALEGESPYDNAYLYEYLQRHMSVMKSGVNPWTSVYKRGNTGAQLSQGKNYSFYTTDGMRFEFEDDGTNALALHESSHKACIAAWNKTTAPQQRGCLGNCGSMGLANNPNGTTKVPCALMVDVNGDRLPNPSKTDASSVGWGGSWSTIYKVAQPGTKLIGDIFTILITEDRAIPYGVVAQKAMYEAQKQGYK